MACPLLRTFRSDGYYYCGSGQCLGAIRADEIHQMPCLGEAYERCFRYRVIRLMQRAIPRRREGAAAFFN